LLAVAEPGYRVFSVIIVELDLCADGLPPVDAEDARHTIIVNNFNIVIEDSVMPYESELEIDDAKCQTETVAICTYECSSWWASYQ
jgi:hypothetical protein